jgi:serine protease Do
MTLGIRSRLQHRLHAVVAAGFLCSTAWLGAAEPTAAPTRATSAITLDTFREVAHRVDTGVVNVSSSKIIQRSLDGSDAPSSDLLQRFFGPFSPGPQRENSLGSGFVVDAAGYILTNRHVVAGADDVQVEFTNGHRLPARVVGRDARTDVALLKVEATTLTAIPLGDSDRMEPGDWVIAIGNPFGLGHSVTAGVVSYRGREVPLGTEGTSVGMIQTDASINPGNSGGPLLNLEGQVIGINTLIITQGAPQSSGVGFAVPINVAKAILPQLREKGHVTRGWLGITIQPLTEDLAKSFGLSSTKGAVVSDVTSGGPAEKAGIRASDVILSLDGQPVADALQLSNAVAGKTPGTQVSVKVLRNGAERTVNVTLGTFPEEATEDESAGPKSGPLGMAIRPLAPDEAESLGLPRSTQGILVQNVEAGKPAEKAGLRAGDVIVSVNDTNVTDVASFKTAIDSARQKGGLARLRVRRNRSFIFVVLTIPEGK